MIKQAYQKITKGLHWIYDITVHGYDTTQNIFIGTDGKIEYVNKEFLERLEQISKEYLIPFPTEFAKRVSALNNKNPTSKLEEKL